MKSVGIVGVGLVVLVVAGPAWAGPVPALKAVPFVEFTDPAGDVQDQNGPGNDRDVVKARIESDGSSILVSATLNEDEHGTMASAVLDLYLDTDNKPETGGAAYWGRDAKPPKRGFEYLGKLSVCTAYGPSIAACAGGGGDQPPKSRHARILLDKFKGAPGADLDMMSSETLISGFGAAENPLTGRVLQGKIPYDKLGLKSGQVIRISTREGAVAGEEGFFPDALLALK